MKTIRVVAAVICDSIEHSEPVSHCLFFDAIEMMDHFERLEGKA